MTDDMGFDLKLPAVGEFTFPQWQDWLARYNAVLAERDNRIEKLEAALREIAEQIEKYDLPAEVVTWFVLQKARQALEEKDD